MVKKGILTGLDLEIYYPELKNCILVCTTETKTSEDIENYLSVLTKVLEGESVC